MRRKKSIIQITRTLFVTGMLLSSTVPYNVFAKSELTNNKNSDQILMNLSDEQRSVLKQLNAAPSFIISPDINVNTKEPIKIIVEFKEAPSAITALKQKSEGKSVNTYDVNEKVEENHNTFTKYVQSMKSKKTIEYDVSNIKITKEYRNAINGVAMTIPGIAVKELVQSGVVKRVWDDKEIKLDLSKETKESAQLKMSDSIPQIGVDKLHAENIMGQGIKVGVLDTGIDYNHPDLTGVYKGYRAQNGVDPKTIDPNKVKGWDFINNDADPMETTYDDWKNSGEDEIDYYSGSPYYTEHGTHVAGIIAAQKKNKVDYAVKGVAPDVDLYSYKVLGPYGTGATDGIIAAIDKAIHDEMDVINMSLGTEVNDPLSPISVAVDNAMLSGIVTVVAAGNSGPNEKTIGSPGSAALGITVGASDVSMAIPTFKAKIGDFQIPNLKLLAKNFTDRIEDLTGQSIPIVNVGLGYENDFNGKDLKGKLALIERGEITFDEKIKNAAKAGAKAVVIYNNVDGEISTFLGEGTSFIPSFRISKEGGERLKTLDEKSLSFETLSNTNTEGDHLADFSSRGPVFGNDDIKPDLVAPGVSIFSTVPEYINNPQDGVNYDTAYLRLDGTSMATPHVTGVAALILQEHPDYSPFDVKAALMNSADDLKGHYSVYEAGAGRVDAYQAVHSKTSIKVLDKTEILEDNTKVEINEETASISFGSHYEGKNSVKDKRTILIQNHDNKEKTYQFEVEYHGESTNVQDGVKNGLKLNIVKSLKVGAGESKEILAKIQVPASAKTGRYEGYIHVTNSKDPAEGFKIPFAIRVVEKGIDYVSPDRPVMTNDPYIHQFRFTGMDLYFKLNSPVKQIDILLKNESGEPLGYVGSINATNLLPDLDYYTSNGFSGQIYPFTNDPKNPISADYIEVPEGKYILEMVATDEKGKSYSKDHLAIVDNTPPELLYENIKPGVVEISEDMLTEKNGYNVFQVNGKVTDQTVKILQEEGYNVTQSSNTVSLNENNNFFEPHLLQPKDDGEFEFNIYQDAFEEYPYILGTYAFDLGTAGNEVSSFVFMKKGTEYAVNRYNKQSVKLGDEIKMTIDLKNMKQFLGGEMDVQFSPTFYQFEKVEVNQAFKDLAEQKGGKVNLKEPIVSNSGNVNVGAYIEKENFTGLDGDTPFLDVTFKVIDDQNYARNDDFQMYNFNAKKSNKSELVSVNSYGLEKFKLIPTHSTVEGNILPEAFVNTQFGTPDFIHYKFSTIGAKVYALSSDGTMYPAEIKNVGAFKIKNIPATKQAYKIVMEVPGHFTEVNNVILSREEDGLLKGTWEYRNFNIGLAGDVNGDNVIDILDALTVQTYWGTNKRSADINFDGTVNEKDFGYILKNYLSKNLKVSSSSKPKKKYKGKTIDDIKRELGIQ
ncbi:S8 family serine peptidase [Arthrobacter citreus]|nr:S8 family serine peptidase [Arthrobacter citreus]